MPLCQLSYSRWLAGKDRRLPADRGQYSKSSTPSKGSRSHPRRRQHRTALGTPHSWRCRRSKSRSGTGSGPSRRGRRPGVDDERGAVQVAMDSVRLPPRASFDLNHDPLLSAPGVSRRRLQVTGRPPTGPIRPDAPPAPGSGAGGGGRAPRPCRTSCAGHRGRGTARHTRRRCARRACPPRAGAGLRRAGGRWAR